MIQEAKEERIRWDIKLHRRKRVKFYNYSTKMNP